MTQVSDHDLIRNAIARCCIAFDSKNWSLLKECFTDACIVDYPPPLGNLTGIDDYQNRIKTAIGHLETQHALTTQFIQLESPQTASATTYCRAIHFLNDKHFFAESKFEDKLVKTSTDQWKISERRVRVMGKPRGDWSILN